MLPQRQQRRRPAAATDLDAAQRVGRNLFSFPMPLRASGLRVGSQSLSQNRSRLTFTLHSPEERESCWKRTSTLSREREWEERVANKAGYPHIT